MASGGCRRQSRQHRTHRTTALIDELLSRAPAARTLALTMAGPGTATPARTVTDVLRTTPTDVLEGHLTWLVAGMTGTDHRAAGRIASEDQARILLRVLDERGADDVITRALVQPWSPGIVGHDGRAVHGYAAALDAAVTGAGDRSPFADLGASAGRLSAELGRRRPGRGADGDAG